MKKETIAILDKLPSSCIALDNKKKVVYFNKFAKKQFFSIKKNIQIENIIKSKELNIAITKAFENKIKQNIKFTPVNLKDSYFNLDLIHFSLKSVFKIARFNGFTPP